MKDFYEENIKSQNDWKEKFTNEKKWILKI